MRTISREELRNIGNIILPICSCGLTFVLSTGIPGQTVIYIVSACFSIFFSLFVLLKSRYWDIYYESTIWIHVLSFLTAYCSSDIIRRRFYSDGPAAIINLFNCSDVLGQRIYAFLIALCIICLYAYYVYLGNFLYTNVYEQVLQKMSTAEKAIFYSFIITMVAISIGAHMTSSGFDYGRYIIGEGIIVTNDFDAMMDCDSSAVQWHMRHFDFLFRHPLFPIAVLPSYSIARVIGNILALPNQGVMLILSISNIIRLAVCGICLSRLTKSKILLLFYYTSFPVLLYSIVIERHTWMTFWNVIMVFSVFSISGRAENHKTDYMPVYQAGASNLTGVMIAVPVLLKVENTFKMFIIKGLTLAGTFISLIVVTGNLGGLLLLPDQISKNMDFVGTIRFSERLAKFTNAIKSCFFGIKVSYHTYYVTSYDETGISIIGIIISIIIIIASIKLWKNAYVRVCTQWILFSFILFPVVGFSSEDFSMHMILFSWAIISLVIMLGEDLIKRSNCKYIKSGLAACFATLLIVQFASNYATLTELLTYAARFNFID